MYLTRPKSSKGRSRTAVNNSPYTGDTDQVQGAPVSPDSPVYSRPNRNLRSQSQPVMLQAGELSQDEVLQILQHAPTAPLPSLNKYKVLPSIERRQSEAGPGLDSLGREMSKLSLSELDKRDDVNLRVRPKPPDPGPPMTKDSSDTEGLLLAIRAPCGRRFQQHFDPSDTLLMVRASAEVMFGDKYEDAIAIETMDVPRRTFTDLDMTLAQCGIFNRSVLCISHSDSVVEHK